MAKNGVTFAQVLNYFETAPLEFVEAALGVGSRTFADRNGTRQAKAANMAKARAAKGKGKRAAASQPAAVNVAAEEAAVGA